MCVRTLSQNRFLRIITIIVVSLALSVGALAQDPKKTPPPKKGDRPVITPGKKRSNKKKKSKKKKKKNDEVAGSMKGPIW